MLWKRKNQISQRQPERQRQSFMCEQSWGGYAVQRDVHTISNETDLTTAIAKMLRMAYFETKQTEIPFE